MKIDPRIVGGAALGGFTQLDTDDLNPIQTSLGMGIGGIAGSIFNINPIVKASVSSQPIYSAPISVKESELSRIAQNTSVFNREIDKLSRINTSINSRLGNINSQITDLELKSYLGTSGLSKKETKRLSRLTSLQERLLARRDNMFSTARGNVAMMMGDDILSGSTSVTYVDDLRKWAATRSGSISGSMSISTVGSALSFRGGVSSFAVPEVSGSAERFMDINIQEMERVFRESLGRTASEAKSEALMIERGLSSLTDYSAQWNRSGIMLRDKSTGAKTHLPFSTTTTLEDGTKIHSSMTRQPIVDSSGTMVGANTRVASRKINPFMHSAFLGDKNILGSLGLTADHVGGNKLADIAMDPISALGLVEHFDGQTQSQKVAALSEFIHGNKRFISIDAYGDQGSLLSQVYSNSVDIERSIIPNSHGEYRVGAISNDHMNTISSNLATSRGYNPHIGQSIHSWSITNKHMADKISQEFPSILSPESRAPAGTMIRDAVSMGPNNRLGFSRGFRTDVSQSVASLLPDLFGPTNALDEGYGLFSRGFAKDASTYQYRQIVLGKNKDGKIIHNISGLSEYLSGTGSIEGIGRIKSGEPIGIGLSGRTEKLGAYFTEGQVVRASSTPDGVSLVIKAINDANKRDVIKIFSPDSKSGNAMVSKGVFDQMDLLAQLESAGIIDIDGKKIIAKESFSNFSSGQRISNKSIKRFLSETTRSHAGSNVKIGTKTVAVGQSAHMLRFEDSGLKEIEKILKGDMESFIRKYSGNTLFDETIEKMRGSSSVFERANLARSIIAVTENKAAGSIFETALNSASPTERQALLAARDQIFSADRAVKASAFHTIQKGIMNAYSNTSGRTLISYMAEEGSEIHGQGKLGSVSWLEQSTLRHSGFGDDFLKTVASTNKSAMHEIDMISSQSKAGNIGYGQLSESNIDEVFKLDPSDRRAYLQSKGLSIDPSATHVSYNVSDIGKAGKGVMSVPISFIDTGRSGVYSDEQINVVKQLDKKRQAAIHADMLFRKFSEGTDSTGAGISMRELESSLSDLFYSSKNAITNANNGLYKAASRMTPNFGSSGVALPIGGEASKLADEMLKQNRMSIFSSKERIEDMLRGIDGEVRYQSLKGYKHIQIPEVRRAGSTDWISLSELFSREPVQGPYSTMIADSYIDTRLTGSAIHFGQGHGGSKSIAQVLQYLDFDADTVRSMSLHQLSSEQRAAAMKIQTSMIEDAKRIAPLMEQMGLKSGDKVGTNAIDIVGNIERAAIEAASAQKGRQRGPLAPHVTNLVTKIQESLAQTIGNESGSGLRYNTARITAHALTENILKTAHKDTMAFINDPTSFHSRFEDIMTGPSGDRVGKLQGLITEVLGANVSDENRAMFNTAAKDIAESYSDLHDKVSTNMTRSADMRMSHTSGDLSNKIDMLSGRRSQKTTEKAIGVLDSAKRTIINNFKNNRNVIIGSLAGLGGLAILNQSGPTRDPGGLEVSAQSRAQPGKQGLPPLSDNKEYVRKYNPDGSSSVEARVSMKAEKINNKKINQTIYGDSVSRANVRITKNERKY